MKRFAGRVTAILLTVAMVFTFIPFTGGSFAVHAEDAPQLTVSYDADSGRLEWEALEGAAYYEYGFYDTEMISRTEEPMLLTMGYGPAHRFCIWEKSRYADSLGLWRRI